MPTGEPEVLEFDAGDTGEVIERMVSLTEVHEGWINLEPEVFADDVPPPKAGPLSIFAPPAPAIPLATWTPGPASRKGRAGRPQPPKVGLQHPTGPKARLRLAELGHAVPQGWVVLQDHSRRGLVLAVPADVGHAEVVAWLMRAGSLLSIIPITGRWRAAVYAP